MDSDATTASPTRRKRDAGRVSDERPWWDTFPWWGVVIAAILIWMAVQIVQNDDYNLAWTRIYPGLRITVRTTFQAFGIALFIGLAIGIGQISRNVVVRNLSRIYVEFIRGIPILPLIFMGALVVVPWAQDRFLLGYRVGFEMRATVTLALIYGAYMAEIFRGGIQSIPPGQTEAGRSLGLTGRQTMRSVVLPQAMRAIIPPLGNDFIAVLKDTSLLSVLGVLEITQKTRQFSASTFKFREGYFVVAFTYLCLTLGLSILLGVLERRMTRDRKGER